MADFILSGGGSVYILTPQTDAARDWIEEHIPEDAQWFGRGVAIEHRYVDAIVAGIIADRLEVE